MRKADKETAMSLERRNFRPQCVEPGVKNGHRKIRHEEMGFLKIADVAQALNVSTRTVRRWISDKKLIAHRFGVAVRIAENDLQAFLTAHRGDEP